VTGAPLGREALRQEYDALRPRYKQLEDGLKRDLLTSLDRAGIKVLSIESRVKEFDSFWDKVRRKHYDNPSADMQDVCGLRIICYYPSDVEPVCQVIGSELDIVESVDKADSLEPEEFGYLSRHFVVTPNEHMLKTPSYRDLDGVRAEIQVRTVFQHAWAELSHELAYKKKQQAPRKFRRRLSQLSAMLEHLDDQFDEVRQQKSVYVRDAWEEARTRGEAAVGREMNIDTLQTILRVLWPNRGDSVEDASLLLDDLQTLGMTFPDIYDAYNSSQSALEGLEQDVRNAWGTGFEAWSQAGILRAALDLVDDSWWSQRHRLTGVHPEYARLVERWRKAVNRDARPTLKNYLS